MHYAIRYQRLKQDRMGWVQLDVLNARMVYDRDGNADIDATLAACPGLRIIGCGLIDHNGISHIETDWNKIRGCELFLVEQDGKYGNWWVAAESRENGFDDQVEAHMDHTDNLNE